MMTLFDIMQQAQNGQAMQNLAQQYGLSQQQTQAAIEALLPAFSMGLQRQTQDPYAFGNFAQMMAANPYAKMFDANGDGIPDHARAMGNTVLGQLFGSKEVSNAVAAQAAATTGLGQAILKQMLPVIASMVMGGLSKSASNRGLDGFFGQFAEMMGGRPPAQPQHQPNPVNPFDAMLGGLFGNAGQPPRQPTQAQPEQTGGAMGPDAFGGMFGQILSGMMGGAQPGASAANQAPPEPEAKPEAPEQRQADAAAGPGAIGLDALNQMFEHGRKVQDQHQNALKEIFDSMLGGQQRR